MKTGRGRLSLHAAWIPRLVSVIFLIGVIMMTSACGGSPRSQQQASQSETQLDQLIRYAQQIGVSVQNLAPIQRQEQQVSSAGAPFSPFNDQADTNYYRHLATQYTAIQHQLQTLITTTTDRLKVQASQSLQAFRQMLSHRQIQKIGNLRPFFDQYIQDQSLFSQAHYPKDFAAVSQNDQQETQALGQMGFVFDRLTFFKNMIRQLPAARCAITAKQTQSRSDTHLVTTSSTSTAFRHLDNLIDVQYQLAGGNGTRAV